MGRTKCNLRIDDIIKVNINGGIHEVSVAGLERGCGIGSPIYVKFYIDWYEGPILYTWPLSKIAEMNKDEIN